MENRYDVRVLFGLPDEKIWHKLVYDGKLIISPPSAIGFYFKSKSYYSERKNLKLMIKAYEESYGVLIKNGWKPDLIHAHSTIFGGIIASHLSKKYKIPFIVTEHQMFLLHDRSRFVQSLVFKALELSSRVLAVSTDKMKFILMHGIKCDPIVVGNLVDDVIFKIRKKRKDKKMFEILIVAAASPIKDLETFLAAIREMILNGHTDIHATMIGGGLWGNQNINSTARRFGIRKYCTIMNEVSREKMPDFYQKSDVLVSTSIAEGFQVSILEAMACGKPVVSTSHGGVEDILNEDNGVLTKIRDYRAIAEALIKIKTGKIKFDPERIRRIVVDNYGRKAFEKKISEIYEESMRRTSGDENEK